MLQWLDTNSGAVQAVVAVLALGALIWYTRLTATIARGTVRQTEVTSRQTEYLQEAEKAAAERAMRRLLAQADQMKRLLHRLPEHSIGHLPRDVVAPWRLADATKLCDAAADATPQAISLASDAAIALQVLADHLDARWGSYANRHHSHRGLLDDMGWLRTYGNADQALDQLHRLAGGDPAAPFAAPRLVAEYIPDPEARAAVEKDTSQRLLLQKQQPSIGGIADPFAQRLDKPQDRTPESDVGHKHA